MTDFKMIALSEINPDPNQPRKFFDPVALESLTNSIQKDGVLQAIVVRPVNGTYMIVCGERRFKAATAAGLPEIPATIRPLNDEQALEIQFIENIQRDDVHPMDEATTFKQMLENKLHPYTIEDIAAKINKPVSYVSHRLVLNNLIPDLQKEFWSGKFLIGHAVLFARLTHEDQKEVRKHAKEWSGKEYKSINELKDHIERNIMHVLSKAPFKKDDPTLNPAMGPCTTCPFKSGNNPSLFNDIKEQDRCFRPGCYEKKLSSHTIKAVTEALENEPETVFLYAEYSRYKPDTVITKLLEKYSIKPLRNYDDYSTYISKGDKKIKGIWINGDECGTIQYVALSHKRRDVVKSKDSTGAINLDLEIDGIRQRTKRAAELDDEKVWRRIHDEVISDKGLIHDGGLSSIDKAALLYGMCKSAGYNGFEKIGKFFGSTDRKKLAASVLNTTTEQFNHAIRLFIKEVLDSTMSSHSADAGQGLLKLVAEQYHKEKIEAIETEQQEKRTKREGRAQQRIKALQEQKKDLKPPPVPKKAAKKNEVQKKRNSKKSK